MPVPVALWLPSMIMMPRPCIHSHHHHRHHHHVFVCHHQLALVHPQLPLGSELFELVRLKDLQNFFIRNDVVDDDVIGDDGDYVDGDNVIVDDGEDLDNW